MQRKFIANLLFLIFVNVLIKPFYIFGIDRTVQLSVGATDYGLYAVLYNFSLLYYILLDLGMTNYNNRTISQQPELLKKYFANFLIIKTLLSFLYLGVVFGLAWFWGFRGVKLTLLIPLIINQVLIAFILYFRSNITALQFFKIDALLSVFDRVLVIIVCGILLWGSVLPVFKIEYFIYAQPFAYALTAIFGFLAVIILAKKSFSDFGFSNLFKLDIELTKTTVFKILKESYPYALLVLLMTIYNRIDTIMLDKLLLNGLEQATIYAAAYRLLDAVNIFGVLFGTLLLPIFSRMLAQKEKIEALTFTAFKLIFAFSATVAVCCSFFSSEIMTLLYEENVTEIWVQIFELLIYSFIPVASVYIFGTLMTANANLKQLNIIAISGVILNIVLNYLLIPKMQAYGATLATLITQSLVAIVHIIWSRNIFKLRFSSKLIIQIISFVVSIVLINFLITNNLIMENWILKFVFATSATVLMAFITKLIDLKAFIELLKSKV